MNGKKEREDHSGGEILGINFGINTGEIIFNY